MLIGVLNSNTQSISSIECVMVLVHRLGSIDCVWHTARDLGTSTCLVQGTQCKKYKIKIADCIYAHTIYILAWKITGSFRFEPV